MAGEAPRIVGVEDRLRRAEVRRRLEIMRMVALPTTEFLRILGKMHRALEFFLDPREVVRFVLCGIRTSPWMAFHASEDRLAEVRANVEASDVAVPASEVAVIGVILHFGGPEGTVVDYDAATILHDVAGIFMFAIYGVYLAFVIGTGYRRHYMPVEKSSGLA
jgi:hypothetical protein